MKRILSIVLAVAVLATMCLSLAACGKKLSGKYSADVFGTGTTMTFDGKNVKIGFTVTLLGEVASVDATYKIKGDTITFDFADEDEVTNNAAKKVIESLEEAVSFEEGKDYIKINGVKYEKVD
jgi:uncharacterized lipoprotein YehR (DUF1307 family)